MKAPCAQPATSILLRTKPPCAQSATPPRVASRAGCPASQHRASARLADGGAHYRPKGTEFPRKPCLWADNASATTRCGALLRGFQGVGHVLQGGVAEAFASRPISLRPPAEMFHVKHLYGTRVSLSSMLLACDVLSNALKSATCDVRRIKKRFSDHAVEEASLVPPSTTISIRRFPKQTKPFEKSFPARRRIPCLFVRKRPVFMRQPGSGPFHVAECIRGASCVSRETSVRFCHQTICSSDVDLR